MTNQEIIEMRDRHRRLTERSKTIVADLRCVVSPLMQEAAEIIEWLMVQTQSLEHELNEKSKDEQRQMNEAYAQGRLDEYDKNRLA